MRYYGTFGLRKKQIKKSRQVVSPLVKTTVLIDCRINNHSSCPEGICTINGTRILCVCQCHHHNHTERG